MITITFATPYEILLKGLEEITNQQEFCQKKCKFLEGVFEIILNREDAIQWSRTARGLEDECEATAEVKVKNYSQKEIILPLLLYIRTDRRPQIAYLHLGGRTGPSKNDEDLKVKDLAIRVFGAEYQQTQ